MFRLVRLHVWSRLSQDCVMFLTKSTFQGSKARPRITPDQSPFNLLKSFKHQSWKFKFVQCFQLLNSFSIMAWRLPRNVSWPPLQMMSWLLTWSDQGWQAWRTCTCPATWRTARAMAQTAPESARFEVWWLVESCSLQWMQRSSCRSTSALASAS